jgi:hypothetical protein
MTTKLKVDFYRLNKGKDELCGSVTWDGEEFTVEPKKKDDPFFKWLLKMPAYPPPNSGIFRVFPTEESRQLLGQPDEPVDPVAFLHALAFTHKSVYGYRATDPVR